LKSTVFGPGVATSWQVSDCNWPEEPEIRCFSPKVDCDEVMIILIFLLRPGWLGWKKTSIHLKFRWF
jgi:hypothetical protein